MSHSIYGFNQEPTEDNIPVVVAYLRRGASNEAVREIYKALKATEFDQGCSGSGESKFVSNAELKSALGNLQAGDKYEPERQFLRNCIRDNEQGVWVAFG